MEPEQGNSVEVKGSNNVVAGRDVTITTEDALAKRRKRLEGTESASCINCQEPNSMDSLNCLICGCNFGSWMQRKRKAIVDHTLRQGFRVAGWVSAVTIGLSSILMRLNGFVFPSDVYFYPVILAALLSGVVIFLSTFVSAFRLQRAGLIQSNKNIR